ncbi:MAG: acetyl-CoA carboxylase biotin carboxyl carrier protein subunit [Clostridiales bacterium]|jgi:biotin carboxyl carrier protein|nr:acetyl-CoA carboxylase biotin carboxyl carrier protein subunit [Clostridiales bacterium]MDD2572258.1 acetyl-CoA carboxylase biotin carboxyl carrier protein subunit [Eubacteriales bacterium]MDY0119102.1 acetyl-CoA carboxylase biotin carboxyl carrier protein subunit [Clostridia bacterium]NLG29685.1 acetyl-CoA carboxylase biotin carboxyl carrier protein subunit [Clostridiaceae bacterium]MCK9350404.1 acetyl-CoA carboxylase biotin carboxyl carrier protein subunit [Clostridiales bacterium]
MQKKNFRIVIDGVEYFVEVEEVSGNNPVPAAPVAAAPVVSAAPKPAAPKASGNSISAPLQGNVLDVPVKAGDAVKAGDILVIIEAMKMENEIVAPGDGVIDAVHVNKGDNVRAGDPLISFR